ncbi:hypothetical protein BsWGS_14612 [Bradybaena similaris]
MTACIFSSSNLLLSSKISVIFVFQLCLLCCFCHFPPTHSPPAVSTNPHSLPAVSTNPHSPPAGVHFHKSTLTTSRCAQPQIHTHHQQVCTFTNPHSPPACVHIHKSTPPAGVHSHKSTLTTVGVHIHNHHQQVCTSTNPHCILTGCSLILFD